MPITTTIHARYSQRNPRSCAALTHLTVLSTVSWCEVRNYSWMKSCLHETRLLLDISTTLGSPIRRPYVEVIVTPFCGCAGSKDVLLDGRAETFVAMFSSSELRHYWRITLVSMKRECLRTKEYIRQFKRASWQPSAAVNVIAICGRAGVFDVLVHAFSSCQVIQKNSSITDKPRDAFVQYTMAWLLAGWFQMPWTPLWVIEGHWRWLHLILHPYYLMLFPSG